MNKRRITICDHLFLPLGARAMGLDGERLGESPRSFEWEPADAERARFVTDSDLKHARGKGQIAWLLEPPSLHPENYQTAWERRHEFDAILAHSEAWQWGAWWYPHGGSRIRPENWKVYEKTKNISLICGPKESMPGHKLRHAVAEEFGDQIDVYHNNYNKLETLAPYRFSIVIENERTPGFFSEKLIDCLSVGTIPIYWGDEKWFDGRGIQPFESIGGLKYFLRKLGEGDYISRGRFVSHNLHVAESFACAEDWIFDTYRSLFDVE